MIVDGLAVGVPRVVGFVLVTAATISAFTWSSQDILAESRHLDSEPPLLPDLPILFSIAHLEGKAVVDDDWIERQVTWANHIYWPYGIVFKSVGKRPLNERHAKLETRQDRHDLTPEVVDGYINCFVVFSLRDVDDPSRYRQGVHWRPPGYGGKHFVVVSSIAGKTVLAHELGHFFGNHRHSDVRGNIMSYSRGDDPPFFDPLQVKKIHRTANRFIGSGELVPPRADVE